MTYATYLLEVATTAKLARALRHRRHRGKNQMESLPGNARLGLATPARSGRCWDWVLSG